MKKKLLDLYHYKSSQQHVCLHDKESKYKLQMDT